MKALRRSHTTSSSSSPPTNSSNLSSWIQLRSLLVIASSSSSSPSSTPVTDRGNLKSPWSRRKRKRALSPDQWKNLFTADGKLRDRGLKFLKKVRSGGIDPTIRAEVWPFLLGLANSGKTAKFIKLRPQPPVNIAVAWSACSKATVSWYNLESSEAERNAVKVQKRKEYERLRRRCRRLFKPSEQSREMQPIVEVRSNDSPIYDEDPESPGFEDYGARLSLFSEGDNLDNVIGQLVHENIPNGNLCKPDEQRGVAQLNDFAVDTESSCSDSSVDDEPEGMPMFMEEPIASNLRYAKIPSLKREFASSGRNGEDFATWQRIIRLDAVRANPEWVSYTPTQAEVSEDMAHHFAESVGLKDYDHLEPYRVYHAARLVAVLEAYALYDPEIGYCQGMSDLLSPILAVVEDDNEAFWCFVSFMKKSRHNFRLDEVGIRRQLSMVSKIIKYKDSHLYRHLEKLQAEDCFFVYRMVVVLFRRELTFDQTLCLWEAIWADQAAIRAGIGKSAWGRIRLQAPPTDDLLLFAIAACVLQRRKLIIESYSSMDDILRECNSLAGQLDVWKLLDDAHALVVTLHDKI